MTMEQTQNTIMAAPRITVIDSRTPKKRKLRVAAYARYLMGHSTCQICKDLMADGIKTVRGKTQWHDSVIQNMLRNEKYIGDALLQKTYMADLFTHQQKKNTGELPKYYVHECHPPICHR